MTRFPTTGPPDAPAHLLFAHGAGAPMTSPFLETFCLDLADRGLRVSRFEFGYMAARRTGGARRPPPRAETLTQEFIDAVGVAEGSATPSQLLFIGGKSMGGRIASMVADQLYGEQRVAGLAVIGYPFHPLSKPERTRTAHLEGLRCPALIVQGVRDPFGTREEVAAYRLSKAIQLVWMDGGDHDLKVPRGSANTSRHNLRAAAGAIAEFCAHVTRPNGEAQKA